MDSVFRDLRYAVRSLAKDRKFTFVAVFALALGIGASTVVFSVFYNLLFNAVAAKDARRLVVPIIEDEARPGNAHQWWVEWADVNYLREHNHTFDGVIGSHSGVTTVQYGPQMNQFEIGHVWPDAFELYGVAPMMGRGIAAEDGAPGAAPVFVMSYRTWKGEFGADATIVGKNFVIEGQPATLIGVMPERFHAFGATQELWMPVNEARKATDTERRAKFNVLARVKRGVTMAAASAELDVLARQLAAMHPKDDDYPKKFTTRLVTANEYLLGESGAGQVFDTGINLKSILYDLLAAVLLLLLIACSNVANLLLARATAREKELAVRTALGGSRWQIVQQLLMESLILALGACAAGCGLAWMAMRAVNATMHQKAWQRMSWEAVVGLNVPVLLFAIGITLATMLICGLIPALRATRRDLQPQLVGSGKGTSGGSGHGRLRAAFVISQVGLSIVLLVGAGLMMRSLYKLTHIDMGFNPQNILVVGVAPPRHGDQIPDRAKMASPEGQAEFRQIQEALRNLPGVAAVAVNNTIPGYGPSRGPMVTVPGGTHVEMAGLDECDENCADALQMRMVVGRWLTREEVRTRQYATVLNQRLAHDMFGEENPVGKQLEVKDFDKWENYLQRVFEMKTGRASADARFEIVGVVGDVKNSGPQQPAVPMAFIPPMITGEFILQVRTTAEPASLMHAVQERVWSVNRNELFWIFDPLAEFLEEHTYATPEFGVTLSGPLAGIGLVLVVIGVFSVMAYTVSLQTREIGVRMALGAQQDDVLLMVLRRGAALIGTGIGLGLLASYGLTRFLANQIWGVSATDPWTFGAVVGLVVITGLAACWLPARRAASVDPLVALRYE
ncbi:MAG TPA: ABC transporter permease [Candidatus Acidoferrum sp.]|nr:ABC transporter permease [Candidatus Acidoferrum sp.]